MLFASQSSWCRWALVYQYHRRVTPHQINTCIKCHGNGNRWFSFDMIMLKWLNKVNSRTCNSNWVIWFSRYPQANQYTVDWSSILFAQNISIHMLIAMVPFSVLCDVFKQCARTLKITLTPSIGLTEWSVSAKCSTFH